MDYLLYIGTAFALMFIIEGLLYAVFPDQMRRVMAQLFTMPPAQLKIAGIAMIFFGVSLMYLLHLIKA